MDGVLYSDAGDGRLYAIDMRSSTEKWHVQTIGPNPGYPEVVGDTVYANTVQGDLPEPVGELYAIDRETGAVRWRFRTPTGQQIGAGPVRDGIIYANSEFDGIYALRDDGGSASVVWHVDAPRGYWPAMMVGDTLYQQRRDGSIGAYALADGALEWETPSLDVAAGGPLVSGGMVFQMRDDGAFAAYATPDLIAQLPAPAAEPTRSPTPLVGQGPFTQVGAFSWADTGLATPLGMDVGPDGLLYIVDTKPSVVVVDPKTGNVVRTWGRAGAGPGEFDFARNDDNPGNGDISVAPDGTVYVADGTNHRVQAFKADGTYLSQFGSFGAGPGQFGNLAEIEVGPDGSVYVMDDLDEPLSKFTPDGKFVWRMARSASEPDGTVIPHGLAVRPDGSILLSCEDCHHILVLDPATGQIIQRMPDAEQLVSGGFINLDPAGRMYVSQFFPVSEIVLDPSGAYPGRQVPPGRFGRDLPRLTHRLRRCLLAVAGVPARRTCLQLRPRRVDRAEGDPPLLSPAAPTRRWRDPRVGAPPPHTTRRRAAWLPRRRRPRRSGSWALSPGPSRPVGRQGTPWHPERAAGRTRSPRFP